MKRLRQALIWVAFIGLVGGASTLTACKSDSGDSVAEVVDDTAEDAKDAVEEAT